MVTVANSRKEKIHKTYSREHSHRVERKPPIQNHIPLPEYRRYAYKSMTSDEYDDHVGNIYSKIRDLVLNNGNTSIVPNYLGVHLANRGCSSQCHFCVSGGEKFEESALENQEEFLDNLQRLLTLNDGKGGYIKEIHFDGDSSDPILGKTLPLFQRSVELIRGVEEKDGRNRLIQVFTNGHFIKKLSEDILSQLDLISISVNAYNKTNYLLCTHSDKFELVMSNIAELCKFRDDNRTNQFINASYVVSRAKGITNFSEPGIEDFLDRLNHVGVNNVKFRVDFHERDKSYQEDVTGFIKSLSDSGKFKPMKINIQQPHVNAQNFKYCLSPFLWPVLGPNMKLYACPHSIKDEMELCHERGSVSLIETDKGLLCNSICQPFMLGLNKRFNKDLECDPDLLEAVKKCGYSKTIYPIVKE